MAIKTEETEPAEERKCECGKYADFADGRCRRCQLSE